MAGARYAPVEPMNDVPRPDAYERSDADPRLVGALALGIAVFLLVTPFLLHASYPGSESAGALPLDLPQPPAPRLQIKPKADLERLRADERAKLDGYGWTDRQAEVARIPIERAIELLSQRGLAGWPSAPPDAPAPR
jgi:hypothetical protein